MQYTQTDELMLRGAWCGVLRDALPATDHLRPGALEPIILGERVIEPVPRDAEYLEQIEERVVHVAFHEACDAVVPPEPVRQVALAESEIELVRRVLRGEAALDAETADAVLRKLQAVTAERSG